MLEQACDLILYGAKGDLSCRKLLPALYHLQKAHLLHEGVRLFVVARDRWTKEDYEAFAIRKLTLFLKTPLESEVCHALFQKLHYVSMDLNHAADYETLRTTLQVNGQIILHYFATPPSLFGTISQGLFEAGLTVEPARVVLEKPIGHDFASSVMIHDEVARYFNENQIYRIDHYLGKETVLNLLALRFANTMFASNWDRTMIDHVQISVAEAVGVEGRWAYYDEAGQMRDMVQNHLLQILSLIAMEPPVSLDADSIRDEKLKVLKALRPIGIDQVRTHTVRGQYTAGMMESEPVPGYLEEAGAHLNSTTETFVAIKADIDNWRWAGVPFYVRTGKRMAKKLSEVVIAFRPQPHTIFQSLDNPLAPNKLIIRLQPDEGVAIQMMNKAPGLGETMLLQQTKLDLSFDKTFQSQRIADAYERLLLEAMLGHQYLFVRRDEVEHAWRWVDGIIEAWHHWDEAPKPYTAGSWGPQEADDLLQRDNQHWDD